MIQFNLLPDVKIEYVKAQQTKRLVVGIALIATASSFAIFLLLFLIVHGAQHKNMSDLSKDITKYTAQLQGTKDLNKILTIQNQLGALNGLHDQKVAASREFGFFQQLTPSDVAISRLATDFTSNTMTIVGAAPSLDRVNTFTDTLKFATFSDGGSDSAKAFSNVVLSQFGRDDISTTYTITLSFAPTLFTNDGNKTLTVPHTVTTRSITEQPSAIFQKLTTGTGTVNP
jgi:hypothetical protein